MWDFACLLLEISIQLFFFSFLFTSCYCSVNSCVVYVVTGCWNLCSFSYLWVIVMMYHRNLLCWQVIFLFFSTHIVCLYHFSDAKLDASSLVFLFSGSCVEVLPSPTSRMVLSILQRGQFRCLSFWWDFCNVVLFWIVFSFSSATLLKFFLSSLLVWWRLLPIFPSTCKFLLTKNFDFFLIC